jgi:hypothetical protein
MVESFVIGEEFPDWFKEECKKGRARVIYNEDNKNEIERVKVYTPTTTYELFAGDKVIKTKSGLTGQKKQKRKLI